MSFLQPAILLALPLVALPIVIHLINQRRFQTVHWAAMHFLLAANRMSRGYARLRQWLILAARTLAIAGLVFAISRPLSSGWLGLASGGRVDTTLILLDRSASMSQLGPGGLSKLEVGVRRLAESLGRLQSQRYVLIESVGLEPIELVSPESMLDMPETQPVSASADLPTMLEVAGDYIRDNRPSRCEVWICSDVRRTDWQADSGRWQSIRTALLGLPQMVRYHLLAFPELPSTNHAIRGTRVRRVADSESTRLLVSFRIERSDTIEGTESIPIQLEINGARSEFQVEMAASVLEIRDHVVPIDGGSASGWGRLSLPSDSSPADNQFFFVYDEEVVRRTVLVSDQPESMRPLEFAAAVSPDPDLVCDVQLVAPDQLIGVDLDQVALLVWQAAVPESSEAEHDWIDALVARGGRVLFFPPGDPTDAKYAGVGWTDWSQSDDGRVTTWVGDRDLLANTISGEALPIGEWIVSRRCGVEGEFTTLATLNDGSPLLLRAMNATGNVYFCCTTAAPADSSLASDGVVLYAMLHRAIDAGAQSLGKARQFIAGRGTLDNGSPDVAGPLTNDGQWQQLVGTQQVLSTEYAFSAGVYRGDDRLFAINRSEAEDEQVIVADDRINGLFAELDFSRVDDQVGSNRSLIQEVWRLFLVIMLLALLLEAALSLPRRSSRAKEATLPGVAG